ncbi:2TM domain-containing protein [Flavobacterium foetidum]|uniref:2TM domain-containing protein n=1 Tax=Flavobacterium foetidum TaxID=2026681 RepID=UPI00107515C8|nr:2TM domain-containing protein [Flavobacterium foetidum]KAF2517253.1 2TM domain-containing protein [Flavobacterium foetidum]
METNYNGSYESELQKIAAKKVAKLKSFYSHALIYAAGLILYVLNVYFEVKFNFFPIKYINGFVMCIWTTAFLIQAVEQFASCTFFGEEWEQRKVKSILEKERKNQKWE